MMKKLSAFILASATFLGCDNNESRPAEIDHSLFPLAVGNSWEYITPNESGTVITFKERIASTATINEREYFLKTATSSVSQTGEVDSTYYRIDENGYVFSRVEWSTEEQNIFRLSAPNGDEWITPYVATENYRIKKTILTDAIVIGSTPLEGCEQYFYDNATQPLLVDDEYVEVLAPGLGVVKRLYYGGYESRLKKAIINGVQYNF
jgi:hypothetical protein